LRKFVLVALVVSFFLSFLTGCGASVGLDQPTLDALNSAIDTLQTAPEDWKNVLNEVSAKIGDRVKDVAEEVHTLANDLVASTGVEFRCDADFLGNRAREALISIRDKFLHAFDPQKYPKSSRPPSPYWCHLNPPTIDLISDGHGHLSLKHPESSGSIIQVTGFNFRSDDLPKIELQDPGQNDVRVSKAVATFSTRYQLSVNFQPEDFAGVSEGFSFVLKWADATDTPTIPVSIETIHQKPAPKVRITLNSLTLFQDENAGDTHMAIYVTLNGLRIFSWNNCGHNVDEADGGRKYSNLVECGSGAYTFVWVNRFVLGVTGYTHDSHPWPDSADHENFLGSASLTIDPAQPGHRTLGPTQTDNNNRGFSIDVSVVSA